MREPRRYMPAYCSTLGFTHTPADLRYSDFDIRLDLTDRLPEPETWTRRSLYVYLGTPDEGGGLRISHPMHPGQPIRCTHSDLAKTLRPIVELYGLTWPTEDEGKPWVYVEVETEPPAPPMTGRVVKGNAQVLELVGAAS